MSSYPTSPPPPPPSPFGSGPEPTLPLPAAAPAEHLGGGPTGTGPGGGGRPGRGRGFAAGLLVAALVVGGGAGVGGAALYDAVDDGGANDTGTRTSGGTQSSQVADTNDEPAPDGSVEQVAGQVLPSVVRLDVVTGQGAATGSGVVLSTDGEILTNNHVVSGAGDDGEITVHFNDGTTATATIVGTDPLTDTALIRAEDVDGLTPITLGESENLDVGEQVVAIGSPFGLTSTVTSGIVSALNRPVDVGADEEGNTTAYPAIQTDAAINPGNSGGALVDMDGHLVGINSSIRTSGATSGGASGSIGLGFAIPIDDILPLVDQMRAGETPTHARLGITVSDVGGGQPGAPQVPGQGGLGQDDPALLEGAEVQEVTEGSAAEDAGLESGDIVTRLDDHVITDSDALVAIVRSYRPGDEVTLTFRRDGEEQETTLTLGSDAD